MIHDPAGCGLSWLPFWVCSFLSKFYNGFLSWWWNRISLPVPVWMWVLAIKRWALRERSCHFLAGCWHKMDNLDIASFCILLVCSFSQESPLFHFALLKNLTQRCLLLPALGCPGVISLRFLIVQQSIQFSLQQCLSCLPPVTYLLSQLLCQWLSQLLWGSGMVQLMLSFTIICCHCLLLIRNWILSSLFWGACFLPPTARWGVL